MVAKEVLIRDRLANNLAILEPKLELIDIEKYLPNPIGTRGFVDLLARDSRGKYVLIELKRSDSSSRDAAHELLKYVEGMKSTLSVREDELRLIVVSTHWSELLVPFSSLAHRAGLAISGYALDVSDDGTPTNAVQVNPLPLLQDRLFMPEHEVSLYTSAENLQRGIRSFEQVCKTKKIDNYVIVELKAAEEFREFELRSVYAGMQSIKEQFGGGEPPDMMRIEEMVTHHTHMLYFAMLQMSDENCLQRIKTLLHSDPEGLEEFEVYLADVEEQHVSDELHEKLLEVRPWPFRDYLEIGYPAKFTKILDNEKWTILNVHRYGTIAENSLLTDEAIVSEIRGEQGVTKQRYVRELIGCSAAEAGSLAQDVSKCLEDNPIWRAHLIQILSNLKDVSSKAKISISLLNFSNILLSIYLLHARDDGELYQPGYRIIIEDEQQTQMIFGVLEQSEGKPSFSGIIRNYFDNDPWLALRSLSWGGYEQRDARIVRDLGLRYATYKLNLSEMGREFYKFSELGWDRCEGFNHLEKFISYLKLHQDFVADVCDFYADNWNGFMITYDKHRTFRFRT